MSFSFLPDINSRVTGESLDVDASVGSNVGAFSQKDHSEVFYLVCDQEDWEASTVSVK